MTLAMQSFSDVPVMPVTRVEGHVALGGPIWPAFESQIAPRHCRGADEPADRKPPLQGGPLLRFRRAAVWGGFLDLQFGHLIAEHLTRLLPSIAARPHDIVLLTLQPGTTPETLPAFVWQLLDWFGVERRRIRFITQPALAPDLRVAPQGEVLGSRPPYPEYLDLLDARMDRAGLTGRDSLPLVFVPRLGHVAKGNGGHLGEAYLAACLERLGVQIFDPAKASIPDQAQVYFAARCLIFAEGSAVHGRQILGRLDQDVIVLKRRPGFTVGGVALRPRCTSVTHHDVCASRLRVHRRGGEQLNLAVAFYDPEALFEVFDALDVPLRRIWDHAAYLEQALDDAKGWLAACNPSPDDQSRNLALIDKECREGAYPSPPAAAPAPRQTLH